MFWNQWLASPFLDGNIAIDLQWNDFPPPTLKVRVLAVYDIANKTKMVFDNFSMILCSEGKQIVKGSTIKNHLWHNKIKQFYSMLKLTNYGKTWSRGQLGNLCRYVMNINRWCLWILMTVTRGKLNKTKIEVKYSRRNWGNTEIAFSAW